jgi:hypothetical protein
MGYFKLPLFFVGFLGLLLGANSMEDDLPSYLKKILDEATVIKNRKFLDGLPLPTTEDFDAIEKETGRKIPAPLRQFYEVAGNLRLEAFRPEHPYGGSESQLCKMIKNVQEKMQGSNVIYQLGDWFPFSGMNGWAEIACIYIPTGAIYLYVFPSGMDEKEIFPTFEAWAEKCIKVPDLH